MNVVGNFAYSGKQVLNVLVEQKKEKQFRPIHQEILLVETQL